MLPGGPASFLRGGQGMARAVAAIPTCGVSCPADRTMLQGGPRCRSRGDFRLRSRLWKEALDLLVVFLQLRAL